MGVAIGASVFSLVEVGGYLGYLLYVVFGYLFGRVFNKNR